MQRPQYLFALGAVLLFAFGADAAGAQQPVPALDTILASLQSNVADYIRALPNLFCDEHVVSAYNPRSSSGVAGRSVVDAVFRVRRPPEVHSLAELKESRDIKLVDGAPYVDDLGFTRDADLPLLVLGVFANAPALFSHALAPCFDFHLAAAHQGDPAEAVAIEFASKSFATRPAACPADHPSTGRALVDRSTLHLLQLEKTTPNFPIYLHVSGTWTWVVQYAPTKLAGRTFVLPAHIHSLSKGRGQAWTFDAGYANYHRLVATSRVLPGTAAPPAP